MNKLLFTTCHKEHAVSQIEEMNFPAHDPVRNSIYEIEDSSGITMRFTGEELTSLAIEWLFYKIQH
jgi:hypothetical protein